MLWIPNAHVPFILCVYMLAKGTDRKMRDLHQVKYTKDEEDKVLFCW